MNNGDDSTTGAATTTTSSSCLNVGNLWWFYSPGALRVEDFEPVEPCGTSLTKFTATFQPVTNVTFHLNTPSVSFKSISSMRYTKLLKAPIANVIFDGVPSDFKYASLVQPTTMTIMNTAKFGPISVGLSTFKPVPALIFLNVDPRQLSIVDGARNLSALSITADCSTRLIVNNVPTIPTNCLTTAPPRTPAATKKPSVSNDATTPQPSASMVVPSSASDAGASTGLIVGLVLASIVVLGLALVYVWLRRKRRQRPSKDVEFSSYYSEPPATPALSAVVVEPANSDAPRKPTLLLKLKARPELAPYWLESLEGVAISPVYGQTFTCKLGSSTVALTGLSYADATHDDRATFVAAFREIADLSCDAITRVIGISLTKCQMRLAIATEYMDEHSVRRVLQNQTLDLPRSTRLQMCDDVTQGVWFLQTQTPRGAHRCKLDAAALMAPTYVFKKYPGPSLGLGLAPYASPEVLRRDANIDRRAADIFALGVLCAEILTRQRPYDALYAAEGFLGGDMRLVHAASSGNAMPAPFEVATLEAHTSVEGVSLLRRCWNVRPSQRPSIDEMAEYFARDFDDSSVTL
ncbi:serine/threonine protein kinase [Saprolegnia parasitica CBS 223.65]|uniref:Serine/threonine protein kinase n=1 Tax=Saprolegnia parasitica (strain CBS 223.65) TaxID=695850 RepID=A0A067C5X0_SAPPC|nr:serine/threonine protein kinase [Saprolegnia parasitica CBS 223.65]KDO26154.1 serine/threonine protein kinase [Saprolegnia parasitica CBS 223.65]|eukprot:XP_012203148.1 serine/threonine protein kinase [Saprolegnia parasitica CBS 223.65]